MRGHSSFPFEKEKALVIYGQTFRAQLRVITINSRYCSKKHPVKAAHRTEKRVFEKYLLGLWIHDLLCACVRRTCSCHLEVVADPGDRKSVV